MHVSDRNRVLVVEDPDGRYTPSRGEPEERELTSSLYLFSTNAIAL